MNRKIFLILLLLGSTIFNTLHAQTVEGNWYTPLRNKLLHVTISTDSILFIKCAFDSTMQDYGYISSAFRIEKKIGSTYIVSDAKDTLVNYHLFGFTTDDMHPDELYMNAESTNTNFPTRSDAEKAIPEFKKQHLKITFVNKQRIDTIRKGKDIDSMTVGDFKQYASKIIATDSANAAYTKKKYKLSYLYSESTSRLILCKYGFNALVKGNKYDAMLEKFYENPQTKELLINMGTLVK